MKINATTTVAEIAAGVPASVRVFARHDIDFCCGGKKPLSAVCADRGLQFDELVRAIEESGAAPAPERDWTTEPLGALIDHIIAAYHQPLHEELPRLMAMAAKVLKVHGAKDPAALGRIDAIVRELAQDLEAHMWKEEHVLFPAIRLTERTPHVPSLPLDQPIRVMEEDHDRAGALLQELHGVTDGYEVPAWACATARALFQGLADLEQSMHLHVHLENNILFPRAIDLLAAA